MKQGDKFADWILQDRIGSGGNGEVWLAVDDGKEIAIKILKKPRPIPYARFRDEVIALRLVQGVAGILPVLDCYLPEDVTKGRPWYAMPKAVDFLTKFQTSTIHQRLEAIAQVAETMTALHSMRIAHRDIKPANLLFYKGRCHISDFGLVNYPKKADITAPNEVLGPRWTMAPEMQRDGDAADPFAADVYSLAKTLWIVITGTEKGFDGQFDPSSSVSIRKFCGDLYTTSLEQLLVESTEHRPNRRPSMQEFADRLREWLRISSEFPEHNPLQWADTQRRLFPVVQPTRAIWERLEDIVSVLNTLGETSDLNHLFFPDSGGLDLDRAVLSKHESECVELTANGMYYVLRPVRLLYESFGCDPQWNYFRLEAGELEPTGVYPGVAEHEPYEVLTEIGRHVYADRSCWDAEEYEGNPLPSGSRVVTRYFRGAFVIFQKTSVYNQIPDTYDARHSKMTADQFRTYIRRAAERNS